MEEDSKNTLFSTPQNGDFWFCAILLMFWLSGSRQHLEGTDHSTNGNTKKEQEEMRT